MVNRIVKKIVFHKNQYFRVLSNVNFSLRSKKNSFEIFNYLGKNNIWFNNW